MAWHGESPKVSTSCIDPMGSTLSPENPHRWALTGSSFSLPMPILLKEDAKVMSVELSLSTRTGVYCFVGYDDPYYQWIFMGMLAAFHVGVQKVMIVSN